MAWFETRLLPKINQNIYNRQIKKILKLLGIDRMVTVILMTESFTKNVECLAHMTSIVEILRQRYIMACLHYSTEDRKVVVSL